MRACTAAILLLAILSGASGGCAVRGYDPEAAGPPYPMNLHTPTATDIQVFRDGPKLEIVNSTAVSYRDFDLWINQRYVRHVDRLLAGRRITVDLSRFVDERGEYFRAGGFFRTVKATPVRLVQIQTGPDDPLLGLVTIRTEDVQRFGPLR